MNNETRSGLTRQRPKGKGIKSEAHPAAICRKLLDASHPRTSFGRIQGEKTSAHNQLFIKHFFWHLPQQFKKQGFTSHKFTSVSGKLTRFNKTEIPCWKQLPGTHTSAPWQ